MAQVLSWMAVSLLCSRFNLFLLLRRSFAFLHCAVDCSYSLDAIHSSHSTFCLFVFVLSICMPVFLTFTMTMSLSRPQFSNETETSSEAHNQSALTVSSSRRRSVTSATSNHYLITHQSKLHDVDRDAATRVSYSTTCVYLDASSGQEVRAISVASAPTQVRNLCHNTTA